MGVEDEKRPPFLNVFHSVPIVIILQICAVASDNKDEALK